MGRAPTRAHNGWTISKVSCHDNRAEDVRRAVQLMRHLGLRVGLPMQRADGEMLFPVEDLTLTARQILDLLDRDELNREGVRKLKTAFEETIT